MRSRGSTAGTLALSSIGYLDVVIVKHVADPSTAGLYGALALSGKILLFVVAFVPTVVLPKASRMALGGRSSFPAFVRAMALVVAISTLGLVVYAVAPQAIVTALAGPAFASAAPYLLPYGIAMVLLAALGVVVSYKTGLHRFDLVAPLGAVAVGEAVGLWVHHRTLRDVIAVLIVGNALALVASLYRIDALGA